MSEPYADLTFRTLDPADETTDAAALRGWLEGASRGFHESRVDDEGFGRWRTHAGRDGLLARGAWQTATTVASGDLPVATFSSWPGTLNVGGGRTVDLHLISDVTVAPTHRRRGLLRHLMTQDLTHAVERGRPVAALTVTEGSIYGRFGFGAAVRGRRVVVDAGPRFALRGLDDDGSLELVEPKEAWPHVVSVHERVVQQRRGEIARPSFYEMSHTGEYDWHEAGPDKKLRAVLHLDATGQVDGYALFKHGGDWKDRALQLVDLGAATPTAHLRLWRFLTDVDLAEKVEWGRSPLQGPLDLAVTDPRVVRTTELHDTLWVRLLDLPVALEARPWSADGDVVLEVDDALGHTDGRWRVTTSGGRASVRRTDDEAGVRLSVETLGALYLGDVDVATMTAAGRLDGPEVERFAAMADGGPTPWCTTGF